MHNILVVSKTKSYLVLSVAEQLKKLDYNMIEADAKIEVLNGIKESIDAILLYVEPELREERAALVFLRDKAVEEDVPFFVMGDSNDIDDIRDVCKKYGVLGWGNLKRSDIVVLDGATDEIALTFSEKEYYSFNTGLELPDGGEKIFDEILQTINKYMQGDD